METVKSTYKEDKKKEEILGEFLDDAYKKMGWIFERISTADLQRKGVDLIYRDGDKDCYVDEKAAIDYLNKPLSTFAFEISFYKNKKRFNGWFFNEEKITDQYFLMSNITLKKGKYFFVSKDDIKSLELISISRKKLQDRLAKDGIDYNFCHAYEMIQREENIRKKEIENNPNMYFVLSEQKNEKPFNLIIKQEYLIEVGKKFTLTV